MRIFVSYFIFMLLSGCNDYPPPSESDIKSFFLQSKKVAAVNKTGELKLNAFRVVGGSSRDVGGMLIYKAQFTAEADIFALQCDGNDNVECIKTRNYQGIAAYVWDVDQWSRAGLQLND